MRTVSEHFVSLFLYEALPSRMQRSDQTISDDIQGGEGACRRRIFIIHANITTWISVTFMEGENDVDNCTAV